MIPCTTQDLIDAGGCEQGMAKVFEAYPNRPLDETVNAIHYGKHNTRQEAWAAANLLWKAGHFTPEQEAILAPYLQDNAELVLLKEKKDKYVKDKKEDLKELSKEDKLKDVKKEFKKLEDDLWDEFVAATETVQW